MRIASGEPPCRRVFLARAIAAFAAVAGGRAWPQSATRANAIPQRRFFDEALSMKRLAESSGDQPYGAVLVLDGAVVGEGPSRVVRRNDPTAHAEREAIADAQRRTGKALLPGSVLYSTSRPCAACERAAAEAGVETMIHGEALIDAGRPRR